MAEQQIDYWRGAAQGTYSGYQDHVVPGLDHQRGEMAKSLCGKDVKVSQGYAYSFGFYNLCPQCRRRLWLSFAPEGGPALKIKNRGGGYWDAMLGGRKIASMVRSLSTKNVFVTVYEPWARVMGVSGMSQNRFYGQGSFLDACEWIYLHHRKLAAVQVPQEVT